MIHSYWSPDRPHLLIGLHNGIALCGERGVPRKQLTCTEQQITCKNCCEKYKTYGDGLGIPTFLKRDKNEPRPSASGGSTAVKEERRARFDKPKGLTDDEYDRLKDVFVPTHAERTVAPRAARELGVPYTPATPKAPGSPRQARQTRPAGSTGGKAADIVAMMRRPGGVTRDEVLKAMRWQAVSMQQQAAQCGVEIKIDKSRKPYRYSIKE